MFQSVKILDFEVIPFFPIAFNEEETVLQNRFIQNSFKLFIHNFLHIGKLKTGDMLFENALESMILLEVSHVRNTKNIISFHTAIQSHKQQLFFK